MYITLQDGCDYILRRKANAALGLFPKLRDRVLANLDEDQTAYIGGIPADLSMDVLGSSRKALQKFHTKFWLAVEDDLDKPEGRKLLNFVDGIPSEVRTARVTRTSLAKFVKSALDEPIAEWNFEETAKQLHFDETKKLSARERTLLCIIALAARDVAKANPDLVKANDTINMSSIANRWITHLCQKEKRGLSEDNISRIISEGLEELA
jgi:hypothetical protein